MELKDLCVSLELAKKLKELGVKQESIFHYEYDNLITYPDGHGSRLPNRYAAFTTDELLEILPESIYENDYRYDLKIYPGDTNTCVYVDDEGDLLRGNASSIEIELSNTLAKLAIYLIENN